MFLRNQEPEQTPSPENRANRQGFFKSSLGQTNEQNLFSNRSRTDIIIVHVFYAGTDALRKNLCSLLRKMYKDKKRVYWNKSPCQHKLFLQHFGARSGEKILNQWFVFKTRNFSELGYKTQSTECRFILNTHQVKCFPSTLDRPGEFQNVLGITGHFAFVFE